MRARTTLLCAILAMMGGCATPAPEAPAPTSRVDKLAELRQELAASPDDARLHLQYGNLLAELGNYAEALRAYERSIEKNPESAETYLRLGHTLQKLKNDRAAVGAFETALEKDPTLRGATEGLMVSAEAIGDGNRVLAAARQLADLAPQDVGVVAGYAALLLQYEEYEQATQVYERVLALDPTLAGDHYNLGLCHYETGNLAAAEQAWRTALQLDPNEPSANRGLAVLHFDNGNYDAAWEQVRDCVNKGIAVNADFLQALESAAPIFNAE